MSFSLFRCGGDTYVAVCESMSPPIDAVRRYGPPFFVPARPRNVLSCTAWERASREIDRTLYAVVADADIDRMFDLRPGSRRAMRAEPLDVFE